MLSATTSLTTWLLIGGSIQAFLALFFNSIYITIPVFTLLAFRLLDTVAITYGIRSNPYLKNANLFRTAPVIPDSEGEVSSEAADEKVVVFFLGFKVNHPLGILAPHVSEIGDANNAFWKELAANAPESGYLGSSGWTSRDERGAAELMTISYWRSTEDLHNFAYGPSHRKIWDKWNQLSKEGKVSHLGISHELFEVDRHKWEGVYLNFQPTLLGATSYLRKGDKFVGGNVDDQWVTGLMDASKGKLRTSAGRLGRDPAQLDGVYGSTPTVY